MKHVGLNIAVVTFYLMVYAMTPSLGMAYDIVFGLFLLGNLLFLRMVYVVLKYGKPSKKKWRDGNWYEDVDRKFAEDA